MIILNSCKEQPTFQVLDENDNTPQFVNPPSRVVVREDAPPGTVILLLSATDADQGEFGRITYLLDPKSSQGMFKVIYTLPIG